QTAADTHHQAGRRREALDLLRRMATLDPTNTVGRLKVAELLRAEGLDGEALVEYREVAAELERQGDCEGAAAALAKALDLEPDDPELQEHSVRLLLREGNAAAAEPVARRMIEGDPDCPLGYELLAEVVRALGREDALPEVYRGLAEAHRKRGDEDKARAILQRFVPVEPFGSPGAEGPSSTEGAGVEASVAPDFGAESELELDAGELGGMDASGFGDLPPIGEAPVGLGELGTEPAPSEDVVAAAPREEAVPEARDGEPEQLLAEVSVYLRYGKLDRALASLRAILAQEPDHLATLEKLAEVHTAAGQPEEAAKAFLRAAQLAREVPDPDHFEMLRGRLAALDAEAAAALAAPEPAETPDAGGYLDDEIEFSIDEGLEPSPENSSTTPQQIVDELEEGDFYLQQGMPDEAEAIYRRVLELAPNHPQAMLRLGEIAATRGDAEERVDPALAVAPAEDARGISAGPDVEPDAQSAAESLPAAASDVAVELAHDSFAFDDETLDPFEGVVEAPPAAEAAREATEPAAPDAEAAVEELGALAPATPSDTETASATQAEVTLPGVEEPTAPEAEPDAAAEPEAGFDLAAALSDALDGPARPPATTEEEGFTALFQDFKQGVQQTLGASDVESHYDLGIAYREMGLLDDALEEFRTAMRSDGRRYDALHMLALCVLDLGQAAEALPHLLQALDEGVPEDRQPALRYDLGSVLESLGRPAEALESFRFVAGIEPGFLDVDARIDALAAPGGAPVQDSPREAFESFDDVVSSFQEEPTPEESSAPPEPVQPSEPVEAPESVPIPEPSEGPEPDTGTRPPTRPRRRKISFF
ncbi:MAG: tetratricopeptide repeat protein, partial [Myxococcota bacterium]